MLEYRLAHHGTVVLREMIARDVWKQRFAIPLSTMSSTCMLRAFVARSTTVPHKLLHTMRGVGFELR